MEGLDLFNMGATASATAAAVWATIRVELRYLRRDVDDLKDEQLRQWEAIQQWQRKSVKTPAR